MRKSILTLSVLAALATPMLACAQQAAAPQSPHTFTGNLGIVTDYRFRGISQTFNLPAIQGGFDYSHASGLYAGTWASNVYGGTNASGLGVNYFNGGLEWDVYGGYKFEPVKDLTLDVGLIHYAYPGAKWAVATQDKYGNTEVYLGATYKWFTAKYSHAVSDYFGMKQNTMGGACGIDASGVPTTTCGALNAGGSKGSGYLDLGVSFELGGGFNLVAHLGRASVRHYRFMNYTDYKIGLTKDWLGLTWGLSYIDSNAKADVYRTAKITAGGLDVKDASKGALVLSVSKTF